MAYSRQLRSLRLFQSSLPFRSTPIRPLSSVTANAWSYPPSAADVATDEVTQLASSPKRPLTLNDLLR